MISRNILANVASRVWGAFSVYLFVPLYLRFLGVEAYGLVGFYSTLLGVLAFADMGFSAALTREMARLAARSDGAEVIADLVRTYETLYAALAVAITAAVWLAAPAIAGHWLKARVLQPDEIANAIRAMGAAVSLQMLAGLYSGGLMGLQRQVEANALQMAWGAVRGLGTVAVLGLWHASIGVFVTCQVVSNAAYCAAARALLRRATRCAIRAPRWAGSELRATWRYAAGMSAIALVSAFLTQADKLTVSKMLPLDMLGYYSLAAMLATIPTALAGPIAIAVFPRFTALASAGEQQRLGRLYLQAYELAALAAIPSALTAALFAYDLLRAWSGSAPAAATAAPAAVFLLAGQLVQAAAVVPYYLALGFNSLRLNLLAGIVSAVVIVPLLVLLVGRYGIAGGGAAWLAVNLATMPLCVYLQHRRFVPGLMTWRTVFAIARPLPISAAVALAGRALLHPGGTRAMTLMGIAAVWSVAAAASCLASPTLREQWRTRSFRALYSA